MSKVSVVILNWNGLRHLARCLDALWAQTFTDFEVILVDNGSTDGSVEWIAEHAPQARLLRNAVNAGYAAANNQAIRASQAPFVATLNNDTQVEPGWLEALVAAADDPSVGSCASKMLFAARPEVINSTGICLDVTGFAWDRRGGELDDEREREPVEIFGPCAGAALYRRAMLDQIGLFDEAFFAYLEDVDLAWRAQMAGWRCLYAPTARVYHVHSATSVEGSPFKNHMLGRNKVWLIAKNYPLGRMLLHLPFILSYDLGAVLFALITRREGSLLVGRLEGLAELPRVWRQRRGVQALWRKDVSWRRWLDPLDPPWRVWARYDTLRRALWEGK